MFPARSPASVPLHTGVPLRPPSTLSDDPRSSHMQQQSSSHQRPAAFPPPAFAEISPQQPWRPFARPRAEPTPASHLSAYHPPTAAIRVASSITESHAQLDGQDLRQEQSKHPWPIAEGMISPDIISHSLQQPLPDQRSSAHSTPQPRTAFHMAQPPEHSPRRSFLSSASPPRLFNVPADQPLPPPMFGQRQMLPPSPQHYQPRYSQPPTPQPLSSTLVHAEPRSLPPVQNRPGSSMSISSMLGSDSDKPPRDPTQTLPHSSLASYTSSATTPSGGAMSPPQYPTRPLIGEHPYKPRSQTPDVGFANLLSNRQHRSSSGSMTQRPRPFESQEYRPMVRIPQSRFGEPLEPRSPSDAANRNEDPSDRMRRTSLVGGLQRPSSQPQPSEGLPVSRPSPTFLHASRPAWMESLPPTSTAPARQPTDEHARRQSLGADSRRDFGSSTTSQSGPTSSYDTRPPGFGTTSQQPRYGVQDRDVQLSQPQREPPTTHPVSPDGRRQVSDPSPTRNTTGPPNGQTNLNNPFHRAEAQATSNPMARQDSSQSQAERSVFGERLERRGPRLFSPFASSTASQSFSATSAPPEDQTRKGSDELSQHRALLGVAAEGKRGGRFSPLPQAVQGAQAQSVGPEAGIKTEVGRVFSGIGSGVGTVTAGPSTAPPGLSASPFRRDDGSSRILSEDNLMKVSRSTPGLSKRTRKLKEEDGKADSEGAEGRGTSITGRGAKRARHHHHHHYKLDNEEVATSLQRRNTPFSGLNPIRRASTPGAAATSSGLHHHHHHHHHHHRHPNPVPQPPLFKPNTTIKIASVLQSVSRNPRHHLGSYVYSPTITVPDLHTPLRTKLGVSIHPSLLPSFTDSELFNCTYTVRVSRTWLRHDERESISAERFLWGSGIYTDDSDPVAAAIHSGFVKGAWNDWVDIALLEQIIREQNPKVDGGQENVPGEPIEPPKGMDLHVTLLVLPQLERYKQSVRYGLKSRTWPEEAKDAPHDGVSFMVLDCEWVDEGPERGKGRTGQSRRERLGADCRDRTRRNGAAKMFGTGLEGGGGEQGKLLAAS